MVMDVIAKWIEAVMEERWATEAFLRESLPVVEHDWTCPPADEAGRMSFAAKGEIVV